MDQVARIIPPVRTVPIQMTYVIRKGMYTAPEVAAPPVDEQIEEEAKMMAFLDRIDMLKQTNTSLFFMEEAFEEALG